MEKELNVIQIVRMQEACERGDIEGFETACDQYDGCIEIVDMLDHALIGGKAMIDHVMAKFYDYGNGAWSVEDLEYFYLDLICDGTPEQIQLLRTHMSNTMVENGFEVACDNGILPMIKYFAPDMPRECISQGFSTMCFENNREAADYFMSEFKLDISKELITAYEVSILPMLKYAPPVNPTSAVKRLYDLHWKDKVDSEYGFAQTLRDALAYLSGSHHEDISVDLLNEIIQRHKYESVADVAREYARVRQIQI